MQGEDQEEDQCQEQGQEQEQHEEQDQDQDQEHEPYQEEQEEEIEQGRGETPRNSKQKTNKTHQCFAKWSQVRFNKYVLGSELLREQTYRSTN